MKQQLFILGILFIFTGCSRPKEFLAYNTINHSGKEIKFFFADSRESSAIYPPDGAKKKLTTLVYGLTSFDQLSDKKPNFGSTYPLKIVFNNTDTVYHFNDSLEHTVKAKYLNLLSERCIYNFNAYTITNDRAGEVATYTFTEDDYEFARQ